MSTTNDVLAAKLEVVIANQAKLEARVETMGDTFIRKDIFDLKMKEIEVELIKLANKKNLINWLIPTISAVLGSVLTFLIIDKIRG